MDPFSAVIMAGGGLLGGLMNTSSQQSINAQQMQFATQQASGAFLPQQVANAQKAGINPLAVIGSGSGAGLQLSSPRPGDAITNSLNQISKMQSPAEARQEVVQNKLAESQIAEAKSRIRLNEADRLHILGQANSEQGGVFSRIGGINPHDATPIVKFGDQAVGIGSNVISGAADYLNDFSGWAARKILGY